MRDRDRRGYRPDRSSTRPTETTARSEGQRANRSVYWDPKNPNITPHGTMVTDSVVFRDGVSISIMTPDGQAAADAHAAYLRAHPEIGRVAPSTSEADRGILSWEATSPSRSDGGRQTEVTMVTGEGESSIFNIFDKDNRSSDRSDDRDER
jgi:hypothetical protein